MILARAGERAAPAQKGDLVPDGVIDARDLEALLTLLKIMADVSLEATGAWARERPASGPGDPVMWHGLRNFGNTPQPSGARHPWLTTGLLDAPPRPPECMGCHEGGGGGRREPPTGIGSGPEPPNHNPPSGPPPTPPPPCAFEVEGVPDEPPYAPVGASFLAVAVPATGTYEWRLVKPDGTEANLGGGTGVVVAVPNPGSYTLRVTRWTAPGVGCSKVYTFVAIRLKLKAVQFATPSGAVRQDNGEDYPNGHNDFHWHDMNNDGDAEDAGDHRFPLVQVRGTRIGVKAMRFTVEPALIASASYGPFEFKGVGPDGDEFEFENSPTGPNGELRFVSPLLADDMLPMEVRRYNTYNIAWTVKIGEFDPVALGTCKNRVYVTLAVPVATSSRFESVIDIACRSADGLATTQSAAAATWQEFTDRSILRKAVDGYNVTDGDALRYWQDWLGNACPPGLANILNSPTGIGQCSAFAELLHYAWCLHGRTDAELIRIECLQGAHSFLVKNWGFAAGALPPHQWPYQIDPAFFDPDDPGPYPLKPGHPLVTELSGIPGQGMPENTNPRPLFVRHFVVRHNGEYFDPSYGVVPVATDADHEDASCDGLVKWVTEKNQVVESYRLVRRATLETRELIYESITWW